MYFLTIFEINDDIEIQWQQADPDERTLHAAAVAWVKAQGWEVEDEDLTPAEQFAEVQS